MYYFSSALNPFPVTSHPQRSREGALLAPDRLFKVVLVGNSSVGKTSLLRSFCEGHFHPSTIATVGEKKNTVIILCACEKEKKQREQRCSGRTLEGVCW